MQNWDDLKFCLALERYQTMTAAARAVGTNTATVSRRIDRLTEEAGEPLFLQNIASFSENYHNLNLTLSSHQASLAYGETDIILTHVAPTEGRIIRKKVGDLCVRAYRNAMLEAPTTGWIATAHGVD